MNKNIKRIIAMTLVISAFSAIEPAKYLNLTNTTAYAYSSKDDVAFLKDIHLDHGSLRFSKTKTSYEVKVGSSTDEIIITAKPEESDYEVSIDGDDSTGECSKTVDLKKGKNTFKIKVKDPRGYNGPITYRVNVTRGNKSSSSSSNRDDDDDAYLDNITLSDGDIAFSRKKYSYDVGVGASVNEIRIKADPDEEDYTVTINGTTVDSDDKYRKTVSLNKGKNVVKIHVENDDDDTTYTLNIYRGTAVPNTSTSSDKEDKERQGDIYLDDLILDDGDVSANFRPKVNEYSVNVNESHDSIIIKAEPDENDNIVRINDDRVDSKSRKRVNLIKGKNVIKIRVDNSDEYSSGDDDYEQRTYTLNVYRGNTSNSESEATNTTKINQWVSVNGRWQYNDALGNSLKNTWYYDRTYGKSYYLQADGYMSTGWVYENGAWYYLDGSGAMQTGWKQVGSTWYYLDSNGKMKTGWFKDINGSWYYLYSSGAMAMNTNIGGYKLGSNGAWIG